MTTIAYKDGVMASDTQMGYHTVHVQKVFRLGEGEATTLVGVSGDSYAKCLRVVDWIGAGMDEEEAPDLGETTLSILMVEKGEDGAKNLFVLNSELYPIPIDTDFFSVGSGSDYAMGAMAMGASAADAIRVASQFDCHTNDKVEAESL